MSNLKKEFRPFVTGIGNGHNLANKTRFWEDNAEACEEICFEYVSTLQDVIDKQQIEIKRLTDELNKSK